MYTKIVANKLPQLVSEQLNLLLKEKSAFEVLDLQFQVTNYGGSSLLYTAFVLLEGDDPDAKKPNTVPTV